MTDLVREDKAGLCAAKLPACGNAVRALEAPLGQGSLNPAADFGLSGRFGGKKHPQSHLVAGPLRVGAVRCKWAGPLVIPVPAQRDRDGSSRCPHVAAAFMVTTASWANAWRMGSVSTLGEGRVRADFSLTACVPYLLARCGVEGHKTGLRHTSFTEAGQRRFASGLALSPA